MLLDTCSATATTANDGQEADNRADNQVEDNDETTQSASQRDTGYKVERVHPDRARHWATTTAEGYVRRAGGGRRSGS